MTEAQNGCDRGKAQTNLFGDKMTEATMVAMSHTDEWYAARSTGIGASEAAAACGCDEYCTTLELYHRKRGNMPEFEGNENTRWGQRLEPVILDAFAEDTGKMLDVDVPMFRHPEHEWMLATPDALEVADTTPIATIEAKSTNWRMAKKLAEESSDALSLSWLCQVQQQMAVFDLEVAFIAVLIDARALKPYRIERDQDQIDAIMKAEAELWERIQNADPPDPNYESDLQVLKAVTRVESDKVIEFNDHQRGLLERRQQLKRLIKNCESEVKSIEAELWHGMGDAEVAIIDAEHEIARSHIAATSYTTTVERKAYWRMGNPRKRKRR